MNENNSIQERNGKEPSSEHSFPEVETINECDECGSLLKVKHNHDIPHDYSEGVCGMYFCEEFYEHPSGDEMEICGCELLEDGEMCNCGCYEVSCQATGISQFRNEGENYKTWEEACKCLNFMDGELPITEKLEQMFCKLCNKELTDAPSRERGIGNTCFKKFSMKVVAIKSERIDDNDILLLLEKFDLVHHSKGYFETDERDIQSDEIYYPIDSPPYYQKLIADEPIVQEIDLDALRNFGSKWGIIWNTDLDESEWTSDDCLTKTHQIIEEPDWTIMFQGSFEGKTLRNGEYDNPMYQSFYDSISNLSGDPSLQGQLGHNLYLLIYEVGGDWAADTFIKMFSEVTRAAYADQPNWFLGHSIEDYYEAKAEGALRVEGEINPVYGMCVLNQGYKLSSENPYKAAYELHGEHTDEGLAFKLFIEECGEMFWGSRSKAIPLITDTLLREMNSHNVEKE